MELEAALRKLIAEVVREEIGRALADFRIAGNNPLKEDDFVDISGAAKLLCVHHTTIREWIKNGRLKAFQAGRVYRVRVGDVKACLEQPRRRTEAIEIDEEVERIVSRRAEWNEQKAEVIRAATDNAEKLTQHEVTKRTRLALIAKHGHWR